MAGKTGVKMALLNRLAQEAEEFRKDLKTAVWIQKSPSTIYVLMLRNSREGCYIDVRVWRWDPGQSVRQKQDVYIATRFGITLRTRDIVDKLLEMLPKWREQVKEKTPLKKMRMSMREITNRLAGVELPMRRPKVPTASAQNRGIEKQDPSEINDDAPDLPFDF